MTKTPEPMNPAWSALAAMRSALCVGVAPSDTWLDQWRLPHDVHGAGEFCDTILSAAGGDVAVFKAQTPFFARFGAAGLRLLRDFVDEAHAQGALVILDAKIGDAEDTMAALADIYLGPHSLLGGDAVTANAYMGMASLDPLLHRARDTGVIVMVLVRTSNHAAEEVQRADALDGRTVAQFLADQVAAWNHRHASGDPGPGGAVIGARMPESADLIDRLPTSIVEIPGLGRADRDPAEILAAAARAPGRVVLPITSGVLQHGPGTAGLRAALSHWRTEIDALVDETPVPARRDP